MENKGLLFIPDISGFTRFINETEIDHSRLIIQELLELLINANQIGLEVSEIEGDAILFYKFGDPPTMEELYRQVENMFCAFHRQLVAYDYRKFCQCKACTSAINLTLKVVTHYGEFTGYNVKNFQKLLGKDVIVAHQLLKNDIEQHEYWLVTTPLLPDGSLQPFTDWMRWLSSSRQTETGEIPFRYTQLSPLKEGMKPEPLQPLHLHKKRKLVTLSREYQTDIITLFHATGDFRYRSRWQPGVRSVEEVDHFLPRVGMRCRTVMESGESSIFASSYSFSADHIEFSETEEATANTTYYTLDKISPRQTGLTITYYMAKNNFLSFLFPAHGKKNTEERLRQSMVNLDDLVKEIHLPPMQEDQSAMQ